MALRHSEALFHMKVVVLLRMADLPSARPNTRSLPRCRMARLVLTDLWQHPTVRRPCSAGLCNKKGLEEDRRQRQDEAFNTCPFQLVSAEGHPCQLLPCRLLEGFLRGSNLYLM
jgi:hypothetical protein